MEQKVIRREKWIDVAKVIAILIVVLNHSGIVIPGVNFWGGMFFVSAFFLLAGYTYSPKDETYGSFVKRKAKRLLIPYFVANFLLLAFAVLRNWLMGTFSVKDTLWSVVGIFYGRNHLFVDRDWNHNIHFMNLLNSPTWFLIALFLTLICAEAVYRATQGKNKTIIIVVLALLIPATWCYYFVPVLLPWSLDTLPCFLLLFFVGYMLKSVQWFEVQAEKPMGKRLGTIFLLIIILLVSGLINGSFNLSVRVYGRSILLCMIAATTSSILLMYATRFMEKKLPKITDMLSRMGKYTLTILCYHYFIGQMIVAVTMLVIPQIYDRVVFRYVIAGVAPVVSVVACILADIVVKKCTRR